MRIFLFLLLSVSFNTFATQPAPLPIEQCKVHAIYGFPSSRKQNTTLICRNGYVLEHDNKAKIPIWVGYVLTPEHATGCNERNNAFMADRSLAIEHAATPKDYAKSGYDMGHMANDGDFRWDANISRETFLLSNMAPQLPEFNRGIWKKLEDLTRGWALSRNHAIQIYVGPIYSKLNKTIGKGVIIPHGFFKVLIDTETNEVMLFTFLHKGSKLEISSFITSLAQTQRHTKLVLPLPKDAKILELPWPIIMKNATTIKQGVCAIPNE